ncbi:MAG: hypothetical protein LBL33_06815, partial [Tannerella sp.]|nr:hypothetical protein [Tannerella sp.]
MYYKPVFPYRKPNYFLPVSVILDQFKALSAVPATISTGGLLSKLNLTEKVQEAVAKINAVKAKAEQLEQSQAQLAESQAQLTQLQAELESQQNIVRQYE